MSKIDLSPMPSGHGTSTALNARFASIEETLNEKVLYRDNPVGEPNAMLNLLDMGSNKIINLIHATENSEAVPLVQVLELIAVATGTGRSPRNYDTVSEMSQSNPLVGEVLTTNGFSVAGKGAGVFDVEEPSGTPDGRGRVLLNNGKHAVLRPPYNIEQFGCLTIQSDISVDLQAALLFCEGAALEIPIGTYTRAKSVDGIVLRNIVLWGHGDRSHIIFNDDSSIVRKDCFASNDCDFIYLHNFWISGKVFEYPNPTNASQCFTGSNIGRVVFDRVTIEAMRFMATAFSNVDSVLVTNCVLRHIARDGIRFVESKHVIIDNNTLSNVADDCIAIHSEDVAANSETSQLIQITNNNIVACQCIKVLGAKNAIISHNIMNFSLRGAIRLTPQVTDTTEGNTPQLNITISDNIILDTFGNRGIDSVIYLGSRTPREFGGLVPRPIINTVPYSYNYTNNTDQAGVVNIGAHTIRIVNNTIARTRPVGVTYSTFGFGTLFDGITPGYISDPVLVEADLALNGIIVEAPITDVLIKGNQVGAGVNYYALSFAVNGTSNVLDISNTSIVDNHFVDCPSGALALYGTSSGFGGSTLNIFNNIVDCDPYFRNPAHNADNTWTNTTDGKALRFDSFYGIFAGGNTFKNCSATGLRSEDSSNTYPNIIHADAVAHGDNAGNKGVRLLPSAVENLLVPINGDPTSATFGHLLNTLRTVAATIPTTGKYVYGHFVKNSDQNITGTLGSQYLVTGWKRISTGTGHVLNTDWVEVRSLTGT